MDKKVLLMILDGWGEGKHDRSNAIYTQGTPNLGTIPRIVSESLR